VVRFGLGVRPKGVDGDEGGMGTRKHGKPRRVFPKCRVVRCLWREAWGGRLNATGGHNAPHPRGRSWRADGVVYDPSYTGPSPLVLAYWVVLGKVLIRGRTLQRPKCHHKEGGIVKRR